METFEPKDDWQGKVSLSAPFSNPMTSFIASIESKKNKPLMGGMEDHLAK